MASLPTTSAIADEMSRRGCKVIWHGRTRSATARAEHHGLHDGPDKGRKGIVNCLNYGHAELTDAAARLALVKAGTLGQTVAKVVEKHLCDLPPVDLMIRTSGRAALLLWQCAHAEFCFTDTAPIFQGVL